MVVNYAKPTICAAESTFGVTDGDVCMAANERQIEKCELPLKSI
jgi:hypothetical protein